MENLKKRKIIIQCIDSLNNGGAERLASEYVILANQLNHDDYESLLLTKYPEYDTVNYRYLKENNGKIIAIYPKRNFFYRCVKSKFDALYTRFRLKKILKKYRPIAIHIHLESIQRFPGVIKHLKGVKLFYTCHNEPDFIFKKEKDRFQPSVYDSAKILVQKCGLTLVALHQDMKITLDNMFETNSIVIYNGINIEKFAHVDVSKVEIRKQLNIPLDAFLLGNVGRICEAKNQIFLIKIFKKVLESNPKAFLLIVGNGKQKDDIVKMLEFEGLSNCSLILENRTDIPQLLKAMDVFVFPSIHEGLPLALIEAQISGLNCVVSDTINKDTFISNALIPLSLNDPIEKWSDSVLNKTIPQNEIVVNKENFDLLEQFKILFNLYIS